MIIQWCSFCSETPAVGIVTQENVESHERVELPCCDDCVKELDWS